MASLLLTLQSRKRKDNTYPVVIRFRHLNRYFDIQTDIYLPKNAYHKTNGLKINKAEDQILLDELKTKYLKKLRKFQTEYHDRDFTLEELKTFILQKQPDEVTVREFWLEIFDQLLKSNRVGTAKSYKNTLSVISKIIDVDCQFRQINLKHLQIIERDLRMRGNNYNSIGVYMRTFRAICNRAISYNLVDLEWYPFRKYKIKKEKTIPKVLSIEEMKKYFNADLKPGDQLFKAWHLGKLLFMLKGINLRDLIFLTQSNVKGDRIIFKRGKTGKMYSIKIHPEMVQSFDVFTNERKTLLGVILDHYLENESRSLHYRAQITKRFNDKLKKLGTELKLSEKLTTYVFRYTYANVARKLGYSKDLIAEALGHEYGNSVTGIYLELFDQEILDAMNQKIIDTVKH